MRRFDKKQIIESANKRLESEFIKSKIIKEDVGQTDAELTNIVHSMADQIPTILNYIAKSGGDKDGELDVRGEQQLNINEEFINEVAGTLFAANLILNAPSIITLAGKLTKSLGSIPKMNVDFLKKAGVSLEGTGKKMQKTYNAAIGKVIKKMRPDLDDAKVEKLSGFVFMTLLATVAISSGVVGGIGDASHALGHAKNAVAADRVRGAVHGAVQLDKGQVLDYSKKLLPAILGKIFG